MNKGVVYTPEHWADWVVDRFKIAEKWLDGATILDPGCGDGALMEAVIRGALSTGRKLGKPELERLIGMDLDLEALRRLNKGFSRRLGFKLPAGSLIHGDFITDDPNIRADIVLGNPPWVSFGDLEEEKKAAYKPVFRNSGLVPDPRVLLLGGARIDVAALFVALAMERHLNRDGEAWLFLPSSLFRGEGAHQALRNLKLTGGRSFRLVEIYDLENGAPFPGAGTRKCLAYYRMDTPQTWPISWYAAGPEWTWAAMKALPVAEIGSPIRPYPIGSEPPPPPRIRVPRGILPRQGVNTGGAARAFILEEREELQGGRVAVANSQGVEGHLPACLVHPLMTPSSFESPDREVPERWIFLPYRHDGQVMSSNELVSFPDAVEWLERHKHLLQARKGTMLSRYASGGIWWALLGVGSYAFRPWKLAWESYGRHRFAPKLFGTCPHGIWQGNQALHAYLGLQDREWARRVLDDFRSPALDEYLKSLGGADTKGWAQPGRIRRLLVPDDSEPIAAE